MESPFLKRQPKFSPSHELRPMWRDAGFVRMREPVTKKGRRNDSGDLWKFSVSAY
jgi:hypothetical protein